MHTLTPPGHAASLFDDLPKLHKIGTYALIVLSISSLWAGQAFSSFIAIPVLVLTFVSWFWELPRIDPARFNTFWTTITAAFIALCVYLIGFTETPFVQTGVYFVLYLAAAKLFQRARLIDYAQLLALSFLLIASSTAFNDGVNFAFFFALYTVIGVVTFAVHHLRSELEENTARGGRRVQQLFGRSYAGLLVAMSGIIFFVSVAFFFLFPRLGFGFFAQKSRDGVQQSGFSENVELGGHGNIKNDNTVVMRIEFPQGGRPSTAESYWRGTSFDTYDGKRWKRSVEGRVSRPLQVDWNYLINKTPFWAENNPEIVQQDIYIEPIGSDLIFSLSPLLKMGLAEKDKGITVRLRDRTILVNSNGDVRYKRKDKVGYQYTALSLITSPPVQDLKTLQREDLFKLLTDKERAAYTQIPKDIDPRIKALAEQITRGKDNDYDRAVAIVNHFTSFQYTTNLPDPGQERPLNAFLFTHKKGHCEYFSTAMTIMLRSLGIPARNVNGFLGGRWNNFDEYLAVRNADAHSWIEIYFGAYGWVRFDPTPAQGEMLPQAPPWYEPINQLYDSLKFKWFKYVIEYNLETQLDLLKSATEALGAPEDSVSEEKAKFTLQQLWLALRGNGLPVFIIIILTCAPPIPLRIRPRQSVDRWDISAILTTVSLSFSAVLVLWKPSPTLTPILISIIAPSLTMSFALLRRVRPSISLRKQHTESIVRIYTTLQTTLQPQIDVHPSKLGPQALLQLVQRSDLPEQKTIQRIIHTYMATRFGGSTLSSDEERALQKHLKSVQKALRIYARENSKK